MKQNHLLSLSLVVLLVTTSPICAISNWSVQIKAELLSHIILAHPPMVDSGETLRFFIPKISDYIHNYPQDKKKAEADNDAKLIFAYVLGDNLHNFKTVQISFTTPTDTVTIVYSCTQSTLSALRIVDFTPESRQDILANVIPYPSLMVSNPSQKYKNRIMGFSLPSHLPNGEPMFAIQMERYSIALASVMYDYVLQRNDAIVSKVVIRYSDDFADLNSTPVAEHLYLMNKMLFKAIKEQNYSPLTNDINLALSQYPTDSMATYSLSFHSKLDALTILAAGSDTVYEYFPPTELAKGSCILRYHDLKNYFELPVAKIHLRAEMLSYLTTVYAFSNDPDIIDSITIQFFPYKKTVPNYSWTFPRSRSATYYSEEDRMKDLLSILPFISEYEILQDRFEILLKEWPGITPRYDRTQYADILAFVAYDFVFKRQKKTGAVSYVSPKGEVTRVDTYNDIYNDTFLLQILAETSKWSNAKH